MNGLPVINVNGTARDALVDARLTAREAIQHAMTALQETAPNGRDYQTLRPTECRAAYDAARAVYVARFAMLDKLANELQDEAIAIQDGAT